MSEVQRKWEWSMVERIALSSLLKEGWTLQDVIRELGVGQWTLTQELKYGMDPDARKARRYGSYDPLRAVENRILEVVDQASLEAYIEGIIEMRKGK